MNTNNVSDENNSGFTLDNIDIHDISNGISPELIQVKSSQKKARKTGGFIFLLCLTVALLTAILGPLLVGGASPVNAAETTSIANTVSKVREELSLTSTNEAIQKLGYTPKLPTMPENVSVSSIKIVNGTMLEISYKLNNATITYRTEQGNSDLSDSNKSFNYTATLEDENGIARMYSGATESKLSQIVWTQDGNAYTLQANTDISAQTLKDIAESIK